MWCSDTREHWLSTILVRIGSGGDVALASARAHGWADRRGDLRGEILPRMYLMILGFQGGGEWGGSEIDRVVTRHPRT